MTEKGEEMRGGGGRWGSGGVGGTICRLNVCVIINKSSFEFFMCLDLTPFNLILKKKRKKMGGGGGGGDKRSGLYNYRA